MKNLFLFMIACLLGSTLFGNSIDTVKTQTKITDVTVFLSGAQIIRQADMKLTKGKYLLTINELPNEINPQSIQVQQMANCKILSVKHQIESRNESINKAEKSKLEDRLKSKENEIKSLKNQINVFDIEEKLLLDNSNFQKKEQGATISEIKQAADFYRVRLNEIRNEKMGLYSKVESADKNMKELYVKLNELLNKGQNNSGQIFIAIDCEKETTAKLQLSYFTPLAGWTPLYDFRVDNTEKPLQIIYNANVVQTSGEKWENVNIKLSTSNPTLSGDKPDLGTWYIDRRPSQSIQRTVTAVTGNSILKGTVTDRETRDELSFANIVLLQNGQPIKVTNTDVNGIYTFRDLPFGRYDIRATYMGYQTTEVKGVPINSSGLFIGDIKMESNSIELDMIEVVDYRTPLISKRDSEIPSTIAGVRMHSSGASGKSKNEIVETDYISSSLKNTMTGMEYTINIPYTIPSDGSEYSIKMKEVSLPVSYIYHAVPKVEEKAFLSAEIIDWQELNLLSGKSSIYYQGTFVGESFIDANLLSDTLTVSLGRDQNIVVTREENKKVNDRRVVGSNVTETLGYDISVKNNKKTPIRIIIEDQFPVSEKKSIVVERIESLNAKLDDKTGKLTWDLSVQPNEKQSVGYKFSVKYPKSTSIYY